MDEDNEERFYAVEMGEAFIHNIVVNLIKYSVIFVLFVLIPLLVTTLTSHSLTTFNVFAGFMGLTVVCGDQIISYIQLLILTQYEEEEEEENLENNE